MTKLTPYPTFKTREFDEKRKGAPVNTSPLNQQQLKNAMVQLLFRSNGKRDLDQPLFDHKDKKETITIVDQEILGNTRCTIWRAMNNNCHTRLDKLLHQNVCQPLWHATLACQERVAHSVNLTLPRSRVPNSSPHTLLHIVFSNY